jgi:hypothetical protein
VGSGQAPAQTAYDTAWLSVAAMAVLAAIIVLSVRPVRRARRDPATSEPDGAVEDEFARAA